MVLDLSGLTFIDSGGLKAIMRLAVEACPLGVVIQAPETTCFGCSTSLKSNSSRASEWSGKRLALLKSDRGSRSAQVSCLGKESPRRLRGELNCQNQVQSHAADESDRPGEFFQEG